MGFGGSISDGLYSFKEAGGFNPYLLNSEIFLEVSDINTLFQDSSALTPATSTSDPVRVVLNKSRGLQRGGELWNTSDATASAIWTEDEGVYTKSSTGFASLGLTTLSSSKWYEVEFTISATTSTLNLWRRNSSDTGNEQAVSNLGTGTYKVIVQSGPASNGNGHYLWFDGNAFTGTLSDVSFRTLAGNHVMAPSDSARPTIQVDGTLDDDNTDDALILPLTGTYSVYIAAGSSLIVDESVSMSNNYDILRDDFKGGVVVSGALAQEDKQKVASFFSVSL